MVKLCTQEERLCLGHMGDHRDAPPPRACENPLSGDGVSEVGTGYLHDTRRADAAPFGYTW
jgi:hypothetical protein